MANSRWLAINQTPRTGASPFASPDAGLIEASYAHVSHSMTHKDAQKLASIRADNIMEAWAHPAMKRLSSQRMKTASRCALGLASLLRWMQQGALVSDDNHTTYITTHTPPTSDGHELLANQQGISQQHK